MHRTRIKICGVTRPEDATAAARAGADAVGMILYPPAPRNVSIERARAIMSALPPFVTPVGVFVESSNDEILDTAAQLGLRTIQLNGDQTPDDVEELAPMQVIKAVRVNRHMLHEQLTRWAAAKLANLAGLVMEPGGTGHAGGSGVANDWTAIRDAIAAGDFKDLPPIIVAGGLTPETVADVIKMIKPWAVDVSSGVEASPGVESTEKIEAFVKA